MQNFAGTCENSNHVYGYIILMGAIEYKSESCSYLGGEFCSVGEVGIPISAGSPLRS